MQQCSDLENKLDSILAELHRRRARQRTLRVFARDPRRTVTAMSKAAIRDAALAHIASGRNPDEERHTDFYRQSLYSTQAIRAFIAHHAGTQPSFGGI